MITGITSTTHHPSIGAEPVIKPRGEFKGQVKVIICKGKGGEGVPNGPCQVEKASRLWTKIESAFSSFKRMLGEYVNSVLAARILNGIMVKVYAYNTVKARRNGTG